MADYPLVSIVIPVYNGADFLGQAIESALHQTYPSVEVLVINDGSADGGATESIARSFGDRIRYFSKANGGVASALNCGIREMHGDYFSWLSHDDLYLPNKISLQVASFRQSPPDSILYSDFQTIDTQGRFINIVRVHPVRPDEMPLRLLLGHAINGCTVLIPRRALDATGFFDETLRTTQDYDFWFRMCRHSSFRHLTGILVLTRIHSRQGSQSMRPLLRLEADKLHTKYFQQIYEESISSIPNPHRTRLTLDIAWNLYQRCFFRAAMTAFSEVRSPETLVPGRRFRHAFLRIASLFGAIQPPWWIHHHLLWTPLKCLMILRGQQPDINFPVYDHV